MRRAQLGFGKRAVLLLPLTHRSSSGKKNFNSSEWTVVLRPVTAYVAVAAYARLAPAISRRGPCAGWRLGITPFQPGALISRSLPSRSQYGRSGCVWLYAVIACSGTLPSPASSNPAPSAQLLTSAVLACHREPVISARDSRARAIRMASPTSSAARRVRFMARWSNTARESSSTGRPRRSRSSVRTVSTSSSRLKTPAGLSNRPTGGRDGT